LNGRERGVLLPNAKVPGVTKAVAARQEML
jgi:hypothetical protein